MAGFVEVAMEAGGLGQFGDDTLVPGAGSDVVDGGTGRDFVTLID